MSETDDLLNAVSRGRRHAHDEAWQAPAGLDFRIPEGIPPPPYACQDAKTIAVLMSFDRESIIPIMPPDVEPLDNCLGGFVFGQQLKGSGIMPLAYGSIFINIKGYDSPTGLPGTFFPVRNFWGEKAQLFFNTPQASSVRFAWSGDEVHVSVGRLGGPDDFRASVRLTDQAETIATTAFFYRPETIFGHRCVLPVSAFGQRRMAIPLSAEIVGDSEILQRLRPTKLLGAYYDTGVTMTWSTLMPLDNPEAAQSERGQSLFFHFLARLAQPAIVVDLNLRLSFMNQTAEMVFGDYCVNRHGHVAGSTRENEAALQRLITAASEGESANAMMVGAESLASALARVIPLSVRGIGSAASSGAPLAVITFAIGSRSGDALSSAGSLELLGLTSSEAKLASLVGVGLAPREAAERLKLTESTVRTVLKRVYSKLQLTRQSELAILVSRIAAIGG